MPIINSTYKAPFHLRNKHVSTILPSLFRKVKGVKYERERIFTPDNDFLDIDWIKNDHKRLVILLHGLEGNSNRHYVQGAAKHFSENGWDVAAWNARSCSGEMNLQPRMYHHADIGDIDFSIEHIEQTNNYKEIVLVGFSMGGALVLNYLIAKADGLPTAIKASVAISAPVDVGASARELERRSRSFYKNKFLKKLKTKIKLKAVTFPHKIDSTEIDNITSFDVFDNRYTAPMHGFANAEAFYAKASAKSKLGNINVPTLLLIAKDDPFMPESCYPYNEAKQNKNVYLEVPKKGGHVGFPYKSFHHSWMEIRALAFISTFI